MNFPLNDLSSEIDVDYVHNNEKEENEVNRYFRSKKLLFAGSH